MTWNDTTSTLVSIFHSLEIAEKFQEIGINAEVLDLHSIKPWGQDLVFSSVKKDRQAHCC